MRGRELASGEGAAVGYLLIFLVIKIYFNIVSLGNAPGACFGLVGWLGLVYQYFRLPETDRGLSEFFAAIGFCVINTNIGLIIGMPTIVIGALRNDDSLLRLSKTQASWFGSLLFIAQPSGSLVSGFLQNRFGRKTCLMMVNVPQLAAWMMIYFANAVEYLFVAVALMGLSVGFLEAPIVSYIGEITQPRLRGVFSCFAGVFYNAGFMIENSLGATVPWRTMILYCAIGPVAGFISMFLLPDSPAWLVTKGRLREAEKAYQWLRGWVPPEAVKEELDSMISYVRDTQGTKNFQNVEYKLVTPNEGYQPRTASNSFWRVMIEPEVLIPFRIILCFFAVGACASLFAMRPFFIEILDSLELPIRPQNVVAICGFLQLFSAMTMCIVMKPLGKRCITFLSLGMSIFCCLGLGVYFLAGFHVPWVPVGLFCVSYFSSTMMLAMPWILASELFPLRARSIGTSLCAAATYLFTFLVTKTYYNLVSWLDTWGTCFFYGAIGLLGLVYLYLDMPETEGVSLEDIERKFSERRSSKNQSTKNNLPSIEKQELET